MRELGQSGEPTPDREATHEPLTEEAKERSSSFFQRNIKGDQRGNDRLLTCRADPALRCRHRANLADVRRVLYGRRQH